MREKADFCGEGGFQRFCAGKDRFLRDCAGQVKAALCGVVRISAGECGICGIVSCHGASTYCDIENDGKINFTD